MLGDLDPEESKTEECVPLIGDQKPKNITISSPLLNDDGSPVYLETDNWTHSDKWDAIVLPNVLLSRKELLALVAGRLAGSTSRATQIKVAKCDWFIGRHVTVTTASKMRLHYWGSGTYNCIGKTDSKWPTWVEVEGHDVVPTSRRRRTSRLAFVVCGIQLKNILAAIGAPLAEELREVEGTRGEDTVTFLLVRYATAHATATLRGPEHRPLCPGPLQHSHSLWTWTTRPESHQRGCFRPRPWERNRRYFGVTDAEQDSLRQANSRAWYDIIQVTNVRCYANVQNDPDPIQNGVFLQSLVWG